jgi:hypothetical protein
MQSIKWASGAHEINYDLTEEQLGAIQKYKQPLERKLAEEQAAKYRKDPDKYRSLAYVADLVDESVYEPYLGAIGGGDRYILHKTGDGYSVQYQYRDSKPIWLTPVPCMRAEGIYRVTPTGLGYIVRYEVDLTDYDLW